MKRVLSLDGGGVRGMVQAYILAKIERATNKPLWGVFDIITGTSTGGLIALLIGVGYSGDQILEFYRCQAKTIFDSNPFSFNGNLKPKFSNKKFKKLADKIFGDSVFSNLKTNVVCPSYCLDLGRPILYRSFDSSITPIKCSELSIAISAAPTYFAPSRMQNMHMVDGGIFMNNPSTEAAATAFELYGDDFTVLSIGNGNTPVSVSGVDAENTGLLFWMKHLVDIMFDGVSDLSDDQCRRILGDRFLRINGMLPSSINPDLGDCSKKNMDNLIAFADAIWNENKGRILRELDKTT